MAALGRGWSSSASAASAAFLFRVEGGVVKEGGKDAEEVGRGGYWEETGLVRSHDVTGKFARELEGDGSGEGGGAVGSKRRADRGMDLRMNGRRMITKEMG